VGVGVPAGDAGDDAAAGLGPRLLPEERDPAAGRLDLVSALLCLVAVLAVVFGLKQAAQDGLGCWPARPSWRAGGGGGFVRRQLRLADPMLDLRLFASRAFNAALATNLLGVFLVVGYFLFVAQYLQAGLRALVEQAIAHLANAWALRRWRGLLYRVRDVYRAAGVLICLGRWLHRVPT
jgi:hypothetical protein